LSSPGTIEREEIAPDSTDNGGGNWIVTVYDNDKNTWEEVIVILMIATECAYEEAEMETWEVHHLGRSVVHRASESKCKQVAEVIATIGIRVVASEDS
jgi:ATP-dependent Clp protease adapter protein ClpS